MDVHRLGTLLLAGLFADWLVGLLVSAGWMFGLLAGSVSWQLMAGMATLQSGRDERPDQPALVTRQRRPLLVDSGAPTTEVADQPRPPLTHRRSGSRWTSPTLSTSVSSGPLVPGVLLSDKATYRFCPSANLCRRSLLVCNCDAVA